MDPYPTPYSIMTKYIEKSNTEIPVGVYICDCAGKFAEYSERSKRATSLSCMHAPGGFSDWNDPESRYRWNCFQQKYVCHFDGESYFGGERFPDYNLNIFDSDVEEYESLDEFIGVEPSLKAFPRPTRVEEEECPICFSFISSNGRASLNCGHVFCMDCISTSLMRTNVNCPMCREEICKPRVVESFRRDEDITRYNTAFNEGYSQGEDEALVDLERIRFEEHHAGMLEGYDSASTFVQEWRSRYNNLNALYKNTLRQIKGTVVDSMIDKIQDPPPNTKFHRTTSM